MNKKELHTAFLLKVKRTREGARRSFAAALVPEKLEKTRPLVQLRIIGAFNLINKNSIFESEDDAKISI